MFRRTGHGPTRNATAAYQAGLAAYETGRFPEAIECLAPIAEASGLASTLARFYLGQAHLKQGLVEMQSGNFNEAARHFHNARRINPDSGNLSRYLAQCHAALRQFDLAVHELERDQAAGRHDDHLPIRLAHAFTRDGQVLRGIETLRAAVNRQPLRADLHYHLGLLHASIDDFKSARDTLQAAARLDGADPAILQHLALAHGALGQLHDAAAILATAQRVAPHDAQIAWLFAQAVAAARGIDSSRLPEPAPAKSPPVNPRDLDLLGEIIVNEPDFVEAFLSLPASELDHDIFAMLAATMQRALERHPDYADLHFHCARVLERLGRPDAAIDEARSALRINPRYVQALIVLGRLYGATQRTTEAIDRLEAAIEAGGDYPDVHVMLGELYRNQGKRIEAGAAYRRALKLNANYAAARRGLESVAIA